MTPGSRGCETPARIERLENRHPGELLELDVGLNPHHLREQSRPLAALLGDGGRRTARGEPDR